MSPNEERGISIGFTGPQRQINQLQTILQTFANAVRADGVTTFYFSSAQLRAAMCHVNGSGKSRPGRDHKGQTRTPRNGSVLPIFYMDLVATDADSASNNTTDTNGGSERPTLGEVLPVANVESTGTIVTNYVEGVLYLELQLHVGGVLMKSAVDGYVNATQILTISGLKARRQRQNALDLDVRRGHYRAVTRGPSKYQNIDSYSEPEILIYHSQRT